MPERDPGAGRVAGIWRGVERPVRVLVWLLIALVLVMLYHQTEYLVAHLFSVLLLFVFAAVIALLLTPLIDMMDTVRPFKGHRAIAVTALYVVALALLAGAMALLVPTLIEQAKQLPALQGRAVSALSGFQDQLNRNGIPIHLSLPSSGSISTAILGSVLGILTGTLTTLIDLLLVLVISIYLLVQGRLLIAALRKLFPGHTQLFDFTLLAVGTTVGAYARGQLIMSVLMGLYTGTVLTIIGVRYAVVIGVLTFFLEFLPLVGAPIGMGLAVVIALVLQGPLIALFAAIAAVGGHVIEAYIVGPRVTGHVTRLHPLIAMAALLLGAELGGILGALFAIPVAALANVFLGALYRAGRGDEALSASPTGEVLAETLPRLSEEIGETAIEAPITGEAV